jgi:periplasmic protein TonB
MAWRVHQHGDALRQILSVVPPALPDAHRATPPQLPGSHLLVVQVPEVPVNLRPTSLQGAALHFDTVDLSARTGNSQTVSIGLHVVIVLALLFLAANPKAGPLIQKVSVGLSRDIPTYISPADPTKIGQPGRGNDGGGGENDPRPATFGQLAPHSSMPILPPRRIINDDPQLPEPVAVPDPNAPEVVPIVTGLGVPWMEEKNDSAGPGKNHGFGSGGKGGMGDRSGAGAGEGIDGAPYANVVTQVACLYCPEPPYTEEARKNKLQGKMLLQVLVGEDGRARQVRVLETLGMGLDESAEHAVYSWRFAPARDAARRPVAAWVTIETRFQLF